MRDRGRGRELRDHRGRLPGLRGRRPRHLDENSGEWIDGTPAFLRAELWGPATENAAISLTSGVRVLAVGTLRTRRWTSSDGERRQALSLVVDEIGPTLRWATTTVTRTGAADPGATDPGDTVEDDAPGG